MLESKERYIPETQTVVCEINSNVAAHWCDAKTKFKWNHCPRNESGVFYCILIIILIKLVLFVAVLLWKVFDIDIFDIGYKQRSNYMRFNITDYHIHYRHGN